MEETGACKVVTGASIARQHRMVVCRRTLLRKRKRANVEQRIKWWKLRKEDCCEDLKLRLGKALGGCEELPDDW